MEIDPQTIRMAAYAVLLAFTTGIQHMAFRTPSWQRRELVRRAIGILTVLLFSLLYVLEGIADLGTWVLMVGLFILAGVVKIGGAWLDKVRHDALGHRNGHGDTAD